MVNAAARGASQDHRRLTFISSLFVLITNTIGAYFFHRLPDDPFHLSTHLSIYSWFACFLGALGIIGAKKRNATLVTCFANFILLDCFLFAIPRFLVVCYFPEIRDSVCSVDSINAWMQSQNMVEMMESIEGRSLAEREVQSRCMRVVNVLQVIAGVFIMGSTVVKVIFAWRVVGYAKALTRDEMAREQEVREMQTKLDLGILESYTDDDKAGSRPGMSMEV